MAKFIVVKCTCGNEQKIFTAAAMKVMCRVCNEIIAHPTGGNAIIKGKFVKELE